jgi:hypothetical protein
VHLLLLYQWLLLRYHLSRSLYYQKTGYQFKKVFYFSVAEETETRITPVRKKPVFTLAPLNNTLSIIEDDDGSITVQSESYKDQGDHTVTEKTTLRRSLSLLSGPISEALREYITSKLSLQRA